MKFMVIGKLIDQPVAPPPQELAMLKATFESFANGRDPRIEAVYPFADIRATALLVEAASADDLAQVIGNLPASRLSTFEVHPLTTPQSVLGGLAEWEKAMTG